MKVFSYNFHNDRYDGGEFGSYCFSCESVSERRAGELVMAGEIDGYLPQHKKVLADLAQTVKSGFCGSRFKNPERSFNDSLQKANLYLERLAQQGGRPPDGCLNFAAIVIRNRDWYFSKIGAIKIYILREGRFIDVEEGLAAPESGADPGVFGSLAAGALEYGDAIMVVTRPIAEALARLKLPPRIAALAAPENVDNPSRMAELEELLLSHKGELIEVGGVCLAVSLRTPDDAPLFRDFSPSESVKKFFLREAVLSAKPENQQERRLLFPGQKNRRLKKVAAGSCAVVLAAVLGVFAWINWQEAARAAQAEKIIKAAAAQISLAETFTEAQEIEKTESVLSGAAVKTLDAFFLDSLKDEGLRNQAAALRSKAGRLYDKINRIEYFNTQVLLGSIPQNIKKFAFSGNGYYFYGDTAKEIVYLDPSGKTSAITAPAVFDEIVSCGSAVVLYSKQGTAATLKKSIFFETFSLSAPPRSFSADLVYCYKQNLYVLDKSDGEIIKYPGDGNNRWNGPLTWVSPQSQKPVGAVAGFLEKNFWIMGREGKIFRYYTGRLQETLDVNLRTAFGDGARIAYAEPTDKLYVFDPGNKRIAILDRAGKLVKQIKSPDFTEMKDFAVLDGGKEIVVFDGNRLLKLPGIL